jgi:hypothetical protein
MLAAAMLVGLALGAPGATAAAPTSKNLTFFLHYVADPANASKALPGAGSTLTYFDTTTDWNNTNATFYANGSLQNFAWYLVPALAGPVNLTAYSLAIWAQALDAGSTNAQTTVAIFERNSTGAENPVQSTNFGSQNFLNTPTLKQFNTTLGAPHIFGAGSSLKVVLTLNPGTGSLAVLFDTARADSRVVLATADSLAVASIEVRDATGTAVASLDPQASDTTAHIQATLTDPYGGYDILWVRATILSPTGAVLVDNGSMAKTSGTPLSFQTVFDLSWNYSGQPPGEYSAVVYAMDNNGENWFTHFAQFSFGPYGDWLSRSFYIGSLPLYAWVKVVDDHGVPLEDAHVTLEATGSPVAAGDTDASGMVNLTAFSGNYTVKVAWSGVQVASLALNLTGNLTAQAPWVVNASVFYPVLKVSDSHTAPVESAFVYLTYPNGTTTFVPFRTDANGSVNLAQVTGGSLGVRVLWRGVEVAATTLTVASSGQMAVAASVFYLTVQVNDGSGGPLELALVRMDDAVFGLLSVAGVTGANGSLVQRLPTGTYDLAVSWRGVDVGSAAAQALTADATVTIAARVYVLSIRTVASDNSPLPGVTVTVTTASGGVFEVVVTDANGTARVRAPAAIYAVSGHYAATAYWSPIDQVVTAPDTTLDQAKTVELKFDKAPGAFVGSNMFLGIIIIALLLVALVLLRMRYAAKVEEIRNTHSSMGTQAEAKPGETKQAEK